MASNRARDEALPWHTDANSLLAQSTDVIVVSLGYPDKFRIGPLKHDYTYSQLEQGLFKCCRASDQGKIKSSTLRLYLYFSSEGFWVAADAPERGACSNKRELSVLDSYSFPVVCARDRLVVT